MHALYTKIGAGHYFDLPYLFQWDDFAGEQPKFTREQQALAVAMGRYFGQFAATGGPQCRWSSALVPDERWPDGSANTRRRQGTGGVRSVPISKYHDGHKVEFWAGLWCRKLLQRLPKLVCRQEPPSSGSSTGINGLAVFQPDCRFGPAAMG